MSINFKELVHKDYWIDWKLNDFKLVVFIKQGDKIIKKFVPEKWDLSNYEVFLRAIEYMHKL
jgi:hypothetical protein